jgi:hypothetical protein
VAVAVDEQDGAADSTVHLTTQFGTPYMLPGGKWAVGQLSSGLYRDGSRLYRVPISTVGTFHAGRAQLLVEGPFLATFAWNYAMSPDGRLLVLLNSPERQARALEVITAFPSTVERLACSR